MYIRKIMPFGIYKEDYAAFWYIFYEDEDEAAF